VLSMASLISSVRSSSSASEGAGVIPTTPQKEADADLSQLIEIHLFLKSQALMHFIYV
jgi:hypothetical protein